MKLSKYVVTKQGSVINKSTGKELKQVVTKNGYCMVSVREETGIRTQLYIHRLVAAEHLPNPTNLPCVHHKDGDKKNNRVDNLEWTDYDSNEIQKNIQLKGYLYAKSFSGKEYGPFRSVKHAIKDLGIEGTYKSISSSISKTLAGQYKYSYGYYWYRHK